MAKRKAGTRRKKQQQRQQRTLWVGGSIVAVVVIVGILLLAAGDNRTRVTFPDIHGMSFSGDGARLWVATHNGLVTYDGAAWSKPDLPINDYMGYSGTEDGFFSSGHPGPGSNLINPLGLVRSRDFGATVTTINFAGQSDFHTMTATYYDDTVYVFNPRPNSLLAEAGLYYSTDGGETWEQSAVNGLTAQPIQIATHPRQGNIVAVATQQGLLLSEDFGDTFTPITQQEFVTAVAFDPDGERLIYGFDTLFAYTLAEGTTQPLAAAPEVDTQQAIFYIAINPASDALAVATTDRDIFYSTDDGASWRMIGEDGVSR